MKSTKLVGIGGIARKIRIFRERGKIEIERNKGPKCNKLKLGINAARRRPLHCHDTWPLFSAMRRPRES